MSQTSTPSAPPAAAKPGSTGSAVRLILLLGILALVIGAWYYDYSVAGPGSNAKYDEIEKMAAEKNAMGVKDGGTVSSDDVAKVVGFPPTYVENGENHTVEWYCWWGKIPGLSTWKRYITVVYIGQPRRFSSHYKNEAPPQEAMPGNEQIEPSTEPDAGGQVVAPPATTDLPEGSTGGRRKGPGSSSEGENETKSSSDTDKPAADKPESDTPAADKPATEKPESDKADSEKPEANKDSDTKPADPPPSAGA